MESQQRTPRTISEINQALDTVDENMFNLLTDVNNAGERYGWSSLRVLDGLAKIDEMKGEIARLEELRRALWQQPTAQAS